MKLLLEIIYKDSLRQVSPRHTYKSPWYTNKSGGPQGRISDVQLNDKTVVEAKFVKEQGMDRQIK